MDKLNFEINLEEKDAVDFAKLHFYKTQKWFYLFFIAFTAALVYIGVGRILNGTNDYTTYIFMHIGPLMYLAYYASMIRTAKNNYNSRNIDKITMEYRVDENGIIQTSGEFINDVKWTDIHRITENKAMIAIYVSKVHSMIIPKDKITSETLQSLKDLMIKFTDENKNKLM